MDEGLCSLFGGFGRVEGVKKARGGSLLGVLKYHSCESLSVCLLGV